MLCCASFKHLSIAVTAAYLALALWHRGEGGGGAAMVRTLAGLRRGTVSESMMR